MKITAMAVMAMMVGTGTFANPHVSDVEVLNNPKVITALKSIWTQSAFGVLNVEATFRLDGSASDYRIVVVPSTNQFMRQVVPVVSGITFAVFHVHPMRGQPDPSQTDKNVADTYQLKIYTIHVRGLYEYDPVTKQTTKLRDGVDWMKRVQR